MILDRGYELAHHGYEHHWPDLANEAQMLNELDRGLQVMRRRFGIRPVGYRHRAASPATISSSC